MNEPLLGEERGGGGPAAGSARQAGRPTGRPSGGPSGRRPLIGVSGAAEGAEPRLLLLAEELGAAIARRNWALLCGGRASGVMEAACRGAMAVEGHLVVGVLPDAGDPDAAATAPLDVALRTSPEQGGHAIHTLSADVLVVCGGGGPGSAAMAAQALQARRPLLLLAAPPAWMALYGSLAGSDGAVRACDTLAEAMDTLTDWLEGGSAGGADSPGPATSQGLWAAGDPAQLPVALVQLRAGADAAANRRGAEAWLERALRPPAGGAVPRLLMLPEIWNAPYAAERFAAYAEAVPEVGQEPDPDRSPSLAMVARLARRHGVAVIAGSIPERGTDGRLFNTASVIGPQGRLLARHRKLHLFDVDVPGGIRFRESDSLSAGEQLTVLAGTGDPLATGLSRPPDLGLLICYDIRFPELSLLMRQRHGCDLLACPAAFNTTTGPRHWHLLLRARAVDNQCFVLACSSARPETGEGYPSYGHSLVVDPWGQVIAEAGLGEQVLRASLDLQQLQQARQAIPTSRQRRTDIYQLTDA